MEREKQIDEMAKALCLLSNTSCNDCKMKNHCLMRNCAECFYKQGYRKVVNCKDCRHLEIINDGKIYAKCRQTDFEFLPFETDTRTHFCALGEMKGAE